MLVVSALSLFLILFLLLSIVMVVVSMVLHRVTPETAEETLEAAEGPTLLKTDSLSTISLWDGLLKRFDFGRILRLRLEQAELTWSVGRITSLMLLFGAVTFLILLQINWFPLWLALLAAGLAGMSPYFYVLHRRSRRFHKFSEAFPDSLDSMARALRAGYPFAAALDMTATESPWPVGPEMRRTFIEGNLGVPWSRALANLCLRVPLLEVNLFTAAVQLHSKSGGRLSEVVGTLAETSRENLSFEGEVRAIAAHGKLTGLVLTIIPIAIAIMMLFVAPTYIKVLLDYKYGRDMIAAAVVCLILAHFIIRRIVDVRI